MPRQPSETMDTPDDSRDPPGQEVARMLQEEMPPIEPPADVREDMLKRILGRTIRAWREWLQRSRGRPDD